jgi:hypothetical protein
MIFRKELAEKVMRGEKTVTRRRMSDNPRSPWWKERCGYEEGQVVAVNPGRGVVNIGRVRLLGVTDVRLGDIAVVDVTREGFSGLDSFMDAWSRINGSWDPNERVWRLEFEVCT